MTIEVRKRCLNCGHRFVAKVLTDTEMREAKRVHRQTVAVHCPQCNRLDLRDGWD